MPKAWKTYCCYLFVPLVISISLVLFLQTPTYSGVHLATSKKYNPINIKRDEYGIPTIEAKTFRDTLFGLGYAHAQDRLWTMNFRKLLIAGRLSELFGTEGLLFDKFFRNLSLKRYCENATEYLDEESKENFQAYVDGINEYIHTIQVLPLQFWLTWTTPEPFTIPDAVANGKFLSFFLALDFPFEFIFETLETLIGEEKASEIIPHTSNKFMWNNTVILNDDELEQTGIFEQFDSSKEITHTSELDPIRSERQPFGPVKEECLEDCQNNEEKESNTSTGKEVPQKKGTISEKLGDEVQAMKTTYQLGSNVWAVHGNHTTTGKPMLASDPHLLNTMPSFWYNAALIYEGNHVTGMSFPGIPGIIIGKSKYVSWGVTNLFADTSDIYTIDIKGENYYYDNAWRPLKKIKETMKIRGQSEPEELNIYESHHGVVIEHHLAFPFSGMTFSPLGNKTYVLSWIGYTYTKTSVAPVLHLPNAQTAQEVVDVWKESVEPSLSLVFATTGGEIGYLSLGKIPVRRKVEEGRKPRDGSKKENDWLGFVPWKDQPRVINPKKGFVVSANNKISTDNIKWRVSTNLMTTSRAARIEEMLKDYIDNGKKLSVEVMKKMQADTLDILAREFIPIIEDDLVKALEREEFKESLTVPKETLISMLEQMKAWDFRMEVDSVPAAMFGVWQTFFLRKVLGDIGLNEEERGALIGNFKIDHFVYKNLMIMYKDKDAGAYDDYWCRDKSHNHNEQPCLFLLLKALEEAWVHLRAKVGSDMTKWTWGSVHTMEYPHQPFEMTPLKRLFQRSIPSPGNSRTVFVSGMRPDKENFEGIWSPNTRMVANMKEGEKSFFVLDTGVSDNVMSKHYDDQMKLFYKNEYVEMVEGPSSKYQNLLEIKFKH